MGSGYPSGALGRGYCRKGGGIRLIIYPVADPATKKFLAGNVDGVFGYPALIRFSWKTVDTILDKKAVEMKW